MKLLVEIDQRFFEIVKHLIKQGNYDNISQFVSIAIENQLSLEKEDVGGIDIISGDKGKVKEIYKEYIKQESIARDQTSAYDRELSETIPSTIGLDIKSIGNEDAKPVNPPNYKETVLYVEDGMGRFESWIWGQINKILPIKIGLRALIKLLSGEEWVDIAKFYEFATDNAISYQRLFVDYEMSNKVLRDQKFSSGLPSQDREKSIDRFKNHFLVKKRKDGKIDGALGIFKFTNIKEAEDGRIYVGITKAGIDFALLENPIIDRNEYAQKFTTDEALFYIEHVKESLAREYHAIVWILAKINSGINRREDLDKELIIDFQKKWECSEMVVKTQRSGLTSRVYDLGFISKTKSGNEVMYHLTDLGLNILT
ncbi:MAG: hypothetical protein KQI35_14255 [Bacteroidetes bacterium]|nr:hypothetical protein [Bacteroidota bacterium]